MKQRDLQHATRRVYDSAASAYLSVFQADTSDFGWLRWFARRCVAHDPAVILDIGAGPAIFAKTLLAEGVSSIGVDLSFSMLRRGVHEAAPWPAVQANMTHLPFRNDASVAGVLVAYSLLHLPKRQATSVIVDFSAILPEGAQLLILLKEGTAAGWEPASLVPGEEVFVQYWNVADVVGALRSNGFSVIKVDSASPSIAEELQARKLAVFAERGPKGDRTQ